MDVSGQHHASAVLPTGNELSVSLDSRPDGPHSRSGCGGDDIHYCRYKYIAHPNGSLPAQQLSCKLTEFASEKCS
jgi:hypothetical protein